MIKRGDMMINTNNNEDRMICEYNKIKALFSECDEKMQALVDGAIWEMARIKIEMDDINEIVKETGLIKTNPLYPEVQKETASAKVLVRIRANYLNYVSKLAQILGRELTVEEDLGLDEFE